MAIQRWTVRVVVPIRTAAWLGLSSSAMRVAIVAYRGVGRHAPVIRRQALHPVLAYPIPCGSQQYILGKRRHKLSIATELTRLCACLTLNWSVICQRAVVGAGLIAVLGLVLLLWASLAATTLARTRVERLAGSMRRVRCGVSPLAAASISRGPAPRSAGVSR